MITIIIIKTEDGILASSKNEVKGVLHSHLKSLMNEKAIREAIPIGEYNAGVC